MYRKFINICKNALWLLFPQTCPVCDAILYKKEKAKGFCKKCQGQIQRVGRNYCLTCGKPMDDTVSEKCRNCRSRSHYFEANRAVYRYSGRMKDAMYKFKYSNMRCFAEDFARKSLEYHSRFLLESGVEVIIPVPMYEKKEKIRGYNQARVYAKALSELTGIPLGDRIVRRIRDTAPMKRLNSSERMKNLRSAFKLREEVVQFKKVLLVDDIYTTGATLDKVAKVLRDGGVAQVYGMCICIGDDHSL
ncbi:MAG: ComF family protein [Pseudobutyrivibrio sp.]|nr:ComF family protein [Pseudobutyrivibrio sp.]